MLVAQGGGKYTLGLFSCTAAPSEETGGGNGEVVRGKLLRLKKTPQVLDASEGAPSSGAPADSWDHCGELGMHKWELSCKHRLVYPLNPDVVVEPQVVQESTTRIVLGAGPAAQETVQTEKVVHRTLFRFARDDLVAVHATLVEEVGALKAWGLLPTQKIAAADSNPLPIHEDMLHVEADMVGAGPARGTADEQLWCQLCVSRLSRKNMRLHVGGHILKDEVRWLFQCFWREVFHREVGGVAFVKSFCLFSPPQ